MNVDRYSIEELLPSINMRPFLQAWMLPPADAVWWGRGETAEKSDDIALAPHEKAAIDLFNDVRRMIARWQADGVTIQVTYETFRAHPHGDDIVLDLDESLQTIPCMRSQEGERLALSDFVKDAVTIFAVSSTRSLRSELVSDPQSYDGLMADLLLTRLVEAATDLLHRRICSTDDNGSPRGIRPAVGYPSLQDHSLMFIFDKIINFAAHDIEVTSSGSLNPPATTVGMIIDNPEARYFSTSRQTQASLEDYARRRGIALSELARFLSCNS